MVSGGMRQRVAILQHKEMTPGGAGRDKVSSMPSSRDTAAGGDA